ncbi:uncharacterized protein LOC126266833 [Schistocerca gregaria]|uniref:uncharacterized protein LOC126266833 n=1 Tax=Schistocerca gregaria TaxID=7010 RepID=UPI00211DC66C|nr:uncharacterized protein LOC126266833 [Schistocerca gregaria]XP_049827351.1 uncharacterized protein LOC126266833 [Schistocerca gregaria]
MGSSQGRPAQKAEVADTVEEVRVEDKENASASDAAVERCQSTSNATVQPCPRDPEAAVELRSGASDATRELRPSASDAAVQPCPSAPDATVELCPSVLNAPTQPCPRASEAAVGLRPDPSDATREPCPGASDAAVEPCPSASDAAIEPCPGASEATQVLCPDALAVAPQAAAGDPQRPFRRRWAKVQLYTHALCGMGVAGAAASISLPMILHCVSSQLLKHWCLTVRFFDEEDRDRIWLCDFANSLSFKLASAGAWHPRKGERINYMARPVSRQALRKGKMMERKFHLGTIKISEYELQAICSTMRHNGKKYHPLIRNCQDCSKDLCRRLGLSPGLANDHLLVFLCPPLALLLELLSSSYNAATKFAASQSTNAFQQEEM